MPIPGSAMSPASRPPGARRSDPGRSARTPRGPGRPSARDFLCPAGDEGRSRLVGSEGGGDRSRYSTRKTVSPYRRVRRRLGCLEHMDTLDGIDAPDPKWRAVVGVIRSLSGTEHAEIFGNVIRRSIDEVLDGPRTGRWSFDQLEKTEKTYVGTKLEIVLRTALGLDRGPVLDLEIEDEPVDIKWAMDSSWQIPQEAVDQLCLCIGGLKRLTQFQVGIVRCRSEYLNTGQNRDRKRTLSARGRAAMKHIVLPTPIPANFVAEMDPALRSTITEEETIQARVTKLFQLLSSKYGNSVLEALGYPRLRGMNSCRSPGVRSTPFLM